MKSKTELMESSTFVRFLGGLIALAPLSMDLYLPSMAIMADYFDTSMVAVSLTISTYLIGSATGQLFAGTLSDQLGRRPLALSGLTVFTLSSLMIVFAASIQQVQLLRLLQGFGGGCSSVVCLAMIRDIYPVREVPRRYANAAMVMLLAPLIGPLIGALLATFGWQYGFVFLTLYGLVFLLIFVTQLPETAVSTGATFNWRRFFRAYGEVLSLRVDERLAAVRFLALTICNSGVLMSFLTNGPAIFMEHFGLTPLQYALINCGVAVMMMAGNRTAHRMLGRIPVKRLLGTANFLQICVLATGFAFAAAGFDSVWIMSLTMMFTIACHGAIMPSANGTFISLFEKNAGCASSLNATLIYLGGAAIGGVSSIVSGGQLLPVFAIILACVCTGQVIIKMLRIPHEQHPS